MLISLIAGMIIMYYVLNPETFKSHVAYIKSLFDKPQPPTGGVEVK